MDTMQCQINIVIDMIRLRLIPVFGNGIRQYYCVCLCVCISVILCV